MTLILCQICCVFLAAIANLGNKDRSQNAFVLLSAIPVLGWLIALAAVFAIIERVIESKFECILGHNLLWNKRTKVYDCKTCKTCVNYDTDSR